MTSQKRTLSPSPPAPSSHQDHIYLSTLITHHTSQFRAAFSPTLSAQTLQSYAPFATATHKPCAWRHPSRQRTLDSHTSANSAPGSASNSTPVPVLYSTGHTDDGEARSGGKLAAVMQSTDAVGTVCVARWYGGDNIGPVRFTHIETCAREAVGKWLVEKRDEEKRKRVKVEEEEKEELAKNLQERDFNIFSLRGLLEGMRERVEGNEGGGNGQGAATEAGGGGGKEEEGKREEERKLPNYASMSLEALRRVDKARDKTIAFILKEIDRVEEELKKKREEGATNEEGMKPLEEKKEEEDGSKGDGEQPSSNKPES